MLIQWLRIQVLINLVSNAIKNVDDKGQIVVDIIHNKDDVIIKTSNSGKLIPESEIDNIFNSFYQLDTDSEGHGLGLTITKSIVDLHQGEIKAYIENEMNCFEVILKGE